MGFFLFFLFLFWCLGFFACLSVVGFGVFFKVFYGHEVIALPISFGPELLSRFVIYVFLKNFRLKF